MRAARTILPALAAAALRTPPALADRLYLSVIRGTGDNPPSDLLGSTVP
jgi:hypothetical protein